MGQCWQQGEFLSLNSTLILHLSHISWSMSLSLALSHAHSRSLYTHTPTTDSISRANVELPFLKLYLQMRDNDIYCCPQAVATAELNCTQLFCLMIQFDVQSAYSCALCNTPVVYTMPVFMWTRFLTSAYIAKQISFVAWGGWWTQFGHILVRFSDDPKLYGVPCTLHRRSVYVCTALSCTILHCSPN